MRHESFRLKSVLLASIAFGSVAASAQTAPAPVAAAAEDDNLIIVTASKRVATLQDTPISVAVTGKAQIEQAHVQDLLELQSLVPSLKVGQLQSSANTNFIIRGFGNGANNAGIEPSVGVFIDGVYRSRSAAQISDLPNIDRVEVLRGPQSTLFGKNASAGIISIVTAEPKFKTGVRVEASYGNYNAVVLKAGITGPISDTLAYSLDANLNKRDGYGHDLALGSDINNRNRYGFRGQLLWKPSDSFKLRLIADYDKIDETCCLVVNLFDGPTGNAVRALGGKVNNGNPWDYNAYNNFPSTNKIDSYGVSAQADWNINDQLALTSISAYRGNLSNTNADSDFTSADLIGSNKNRTKINTYTQELRLASNYDGFFNFLIGGFFFKEKIDIDASLTFGKDFKNYANLLSGGAYSAVEPTLRALVPVLPGTFGAQGQGRFENYKYDDTAISIFGQGDFTVTDKLTLTAGFNYTYDKKKVATNNISTDSFSAVDLVRAGVAAGVPASLATNPTYNPFLGLKPLQFIPQFLNFPNAVEDGKTHDSNLSYTLRAAYKFSPNFSTYATYATGFKASSWNLSTDSRPFASDFIPGSAYQSPAPAASAIRTAGLALVNLTTGTRYAGPEKAQVYEVGFKGSFDGFAFNVAIFKQILKGFQSNIFQGTGFVLGNAEKESTRGVEIDASATPIKNLNVTASVTYLDPKYDLFTGGSAFNAATNSVVPTNLTGRRPSGISTWSVAVGGTYTQPISDDVKLIYHVDYAVDSAYVIAQGLPNKAAPETLNASLSLALSRGLEVSVWGRNLTEPHYITVIFPSVAQSGSLSGYPSQPRTYGVSARYRF